LKTGREQVSRAVATGSGSPATAHLKPSIFESARRSAGVVLGHDRREQIEALAVQG